MLSYIFNYFRIETASFLNKFYIYLVRSCLDLTDKIFLIFHKIKLDNSLVKSESK